jgi:hypothetical protein
MITKKKHPMRVLFFRDHEISGLRPAAALSLSRPAGAAKDLSAADPVVRKSDHRKPEDVLSTGTG